MCEVDHASSVVHVKELSETHLYLESCMGDSIFMHSWFAQWTIPLLDKLLNSENELAQLERAIVKFGCKIL